LHIIFAKLTIVGLSKLLAYHQSLPIYWDSVNPVEEEITY